MEDIFILLSFNLLLYHLETEVEKDKKRNVNAYWNGEDIK